MQGKIIKKSVPNEPLIREKDDEKDSNEIVVENVQGPEEGKDEPQLRGARSRIKRNQPFRMDSSDGSSKSERTETKPDGTIVRTIVEVNGNQKKTTVITTKGGSTQTNTRIETIGGGGGGGRSGGRSGGFGFSGFDDSGFDDFNKRWNEQVNQMYNNFNNFGNDRNRGYHYEYNSSSGNGNKGGNKGNSNAWHYEWSSNSGSNNKNNNNNNNNKWYYEWGDNSNNNKKNYNNNNNISNNKKNDDWSYEWGTNTKDNKYNDNYQKQSETISGNEFQQSALDAHNKYRRKHHVGNLVLSKDLCNIAQKYAETMARTGNFAHSRGKYNGKNMGENLFACYGIKITGKMMTDDWYNEVSQYNFNNPGFVSGTGHFTQVVWKGSREVGFGFAQARDGYYYGVANYYPAGNYLNEFEENVLRA